MTPASSVLLLVAAACAFRALPFLFAADAGVDHWFWKLYVAAVRERRTFPPRLPEYILDEQQWYPPVFPIVLSVWKWAESELGSRLLPIAVDICRLLLLIGVVTTLTGSAAAVLTAGVIYAAAPILVSYNVQLNPRGFAALLLDGIGVLWLAGAFAGSPSWLWIAAVALAALILLTHKMTTQLMAVLWLVGSLAQGGLAMWLFLPAAVVFACIVSGGFYLRVVQAHWDIITFWDRNWRWLQANPVAESPIYGDPRYQTPTRFYTPGWRGAVRHFKSMFGLMPWAFLLPFVLPAGGGSTQPVVWWAAAEVAFAIATVAIPALRCLGAGYYYLYNAAFPVAFVWALYATPTASAVAAFGVGMLAALAWLIRFFRRLKNQHTHDRELGDVLRLLRTMPRGPVWCFPLQLSDRVAFETGQPVLSGGHGYGFRRFEPIFPRLIQPISKVCRDHNVRYLLSASGYLPATLQSELHVRERVSVGSYEILILHAADAAEETSTSAVVFSTAS